MLFVRASRSAADQALSRLAAVAPPGTHRATVTAAPNFAYAVVGRRMARADDDFDEGDDEEIDDEDSDGEDWEE